MAKALEGIRVLDCGHAIAGPTVGMCLADMGAEVIHVEPPDIGDYVRHFCALNVFVKDETPWFLFYNRNKKSITLNLKSAEAQEIFKELVKQSDVVIENFVPGTMDSFGLGYWILKEVNPGIVMVSISGFGQNGPYRDRGGFELVAQAMGGLLSVTGDPDRPPARAGGNVADSLTGIFGAYGALTALFHKERTGQGQWVDLSLMDSLSCLVGDRILSYANLGEDILGEVATRRGNYLPGYGYVLFKSKDDRYFVLMTHRKPVLEKLAGELGRKELLDLDPLNPSDIVKAQEIVAEWIGERTADEVFSTLERLDVVFGQVLTIDEVANNPQFLAREMLVEVEHPTLGRIKIPGIVPKLSLTPGSVETSSPALGQHNEEIYQGLLGYSREELERLKEKKAI